MADQFGGSTTLGEMNNATELIAGLRALGDAIGMNLTQIGDIYGWAVPLLKVLNANSQCDADPSCRDSRMVLQRLVSAQDDGSLGKIAATRTSTAGHARHSDPGLNDYGSAAETRQCNRGGAKSRPRRPQRSPTTSSRPTTRREYVGRRKPAVGRWGAASGGPDQADESGPRQCRNLPTGYEEEMRTTLRWRASTFRRRY